eukprot:1613270-Alexandrium_andersonii.AAC.1
MSASLVGSEMCIRDRATSFTYQLGHVVDVAPPAQVTSPLRLTLRRLLQTCLLYTSDAADDM